MQAEFGDSLLIIASIHVENNPVENAQAIEQHLDVPSYFTEDNFNKDKINASGRSNAVWLSWLLSRESVIDLISKLFPRSLIKKRVTSLTACLRYRKDNQGSALRRRYCIGKTTVCQRTSHRSTNYLKTATCSAAAARPSISNNNVSNMSPYKRITILPGYLPWLGF